MKNTAELHKLLTEWQQNKKDKKVAEQIASLMLGNLDLVEESKTSLQKSVLRQFLKGDIDFFTEQSIDTALTAGVISEEYKDLLKHEDLGIQTSTIVQDAIKNQLLQTQTTQSLLSVVKRLITAINTELRSSSERTYEFKTFIQMVVDTHTDFPAHRQTKSIFDCFEFVVHTSSALRESEWKELGYSIEYEDSVFAGNSITKNVSLKRVEQNKEANISPVDAFLFIDMAQTIANLQEFMNENLYLVKSLTLKEDYKSIEELVSNQILLPIQAAISAITSNSQINTEIAETIEKIRGGIDNRIILRSKSSSRQIDQNAYVVGLLSITDGTSRPTDINEKNMKIDELTVINRYFGGQPHLYHTALKRSKSTGAPATEISKRVPVYYSPEAKVPFLQLHWKGSIQWLPIGVDFLVSKEFEAFWSSSHKVDSFTDEIETPAAGGESTTIFSLPGKVAISKLDK